MIVIIIIIIIIIDVADCTSSLQAVLFCARLRPRLKERRSPAAVRSHVCLHGPARSPHPVMMQA